MRVVGLPRAFYHIARHPPLVLSPEAQERLRWLSCWQALREQGPKRLGDKSRGPKRLRRPTWSVELAQTVLHLREGYARWGKDKLVVLLRRGGW